MPTATAAAGLTLEAMKRRPMLMRARMKAVQAVNTSIAHTVKGRPRKRPEPEGVEGWRHLLREAARDVHRRAEHQRVDADRGDKGRNAEESDEVPGNGADTETHEVRQADIADRLPRTGVETRIGADHDRRERHDAGDGEIEPRCWMTRCCPIEATASTAKNGSMDRRR